MKLCFVFTSSLTVGLLHLLCLQLDGCEDFVSNTPRAYTYLLRHIKALHIAQSIALLGKKFFDVFADG